MRGWGTGEVQISRLATLARDDRGLAALGRDDNGLRARDDPWRPVRTDGPDEVLVRPVRYTSRRVLARQAAGGVPRGEVARGRGRRPALPPSMAVRARSAPARRLACPSIVRQMR